MILVLVLVLVLNEMFMKMILLYFISIMMVDGRVMVNDMFAAC